MTNGITAHVVRDLYCDEDERSTDVVAVVSMKSSADTDVTAL